MTDAIATAIATLRARQKERQSIYWHQIDALLDIAEAAYEVAGSEDGDTGLLLEGLSRLARVAP